MPKKSFFSPNPDLSSKKIATGIIQELGKEKICQELEKMLVIRHFEIRGEAAYQHGLVGGFFHAYSGQEAIQTAVVQTVGENNWYITSYRCHALALLLGESPENLMAELYGREAGNAHGRGGSMHFYSDKMLGGFAIVGGHLAIATGAAFSIKYLKKKGMVSVCFFGEGAVAQGSFHESLNLASLWDLPVIFVIENNQWGMGTHVSRAICVDKIAESQAPSYNMKGYTLNGMDYFNCYAGFKHIHAETLKTGRPVLVECICERFKGHSISDPAIYRTKEELQNCLNQDPIAYLRHILEEEKILTEKAFKEIDARAKEKVLEAMKYAEKSPLPALTSLEEDVYAP